MRRLALTFVSLLVACRASTADVDSAAPSASAWLAPPPDAAAPPDERLATLDRWNDAMRAHDVAKLIAIYDDRVFFYGLPMSRVAAMGRLDQLFRSTVDYTQTIADAKVETTDGSDLVRVTFRKSGTAHGQTASYAAYIVLRLVGAKYRIVEESDTTTDATMTPWRDRYVDDCRRAIGAALDELWSDRIGPVAFQSDNWFACGDARAHQCVWRYWMPPHEAGFAHRMITLEVDLATGTLTESGGWASNGFDAGLTMAPRVHERIAEACRAAKVYE